MDFFQRKDLNWENDLKNGDATRPPGDFLKSLLTEENEKRKKKGVKRGKR